ncbi:hypothetical protein WR25_20683 isoform B [Diploscapter pachys]|uniref:Uncharacterized protein n=2 Tax=Diploscapter pachys TaxID=2018661 RepID=A0A2A2J5M7_9BILA|nr:hypothetical protein WR25_20683 isoform B [Diploscapter pachys]
MYITGILFILYCYFFSIYPETYNNLIDLLNRARIIAYPKSWYATRIIRVGEGSGTLYLRLGAVLFGSVGCVLFGLELFLCLESSYCKRPETTILKWVCAIVFTFLQMHFIFCNSKVSLDNSRKIAKFGMMHLVSVNLWTWFRFVLAKQQAKVAKKHKRSIGYAHAAANYSKDSPGSSENFTFDDDLINMTINAILNFNSTGDVQAPPTKPTYNGDIRSSIIANGRIFALDHFGDVATFLTTCLIEYSLISAAVMFVQWKSIGEEHVIKVSKRKSKMRIDCSSSSSGMFAGIMFLITTFVSMGMYTIFETLRNNSSAMMVFGVVDLLMFSTALIACVIGLWRVRKLQYRPHIRSEAIDEILLVMGVIGEIIYCSVGMDSFVAEKGIRNETGKILPAIVFCFRFAQVIFQAAFILILSRLRCISPYAMKNKPGKQIITFLLVTNVTLFIFQTYEGMKPTFGMSPNLSLTYTYIIYSVAPLLVFYRFHSSVCFAEIWKLTYSGKEISSGMSVDGRSDSLTTIGTCYDTRPVCSNPLSTEPSAESTCHSANGFLLSPPRHVRHQPAGTSAPVSFELRLSNDDEITDADSYL